MTTEEEKIIRDFAAGNIELREAAITIYRRNVQFEDTRKMLAMRFMSEVDTIQPDLALRALYRKELIEKSC